MTLRSRSRDRTSPADRVVLESGGYFDLREHKHPYSKKSASLRDFSSTKVTCSMLPLRKSASGKRHSDFKNSGGSRGEECLCAVVRIVVLFRIASWLWAQHETHQREQRATNYNERSIERHLVQFWRKPGQQLCRADSRHGDQFRGDSTDPEPDGIGDSRLFHRIGAIMRCAAQSRVELPGCRQLHSHRGFRSRIADRDAESELYQCRCRLPVDGHPDRDLCRNDSRRRDCHGESAGGAVHDHTAVCRKRDHQLRPNNFLRVADLESADAERRRSGKHLCCRHAREYRLPHARHDRFSERHHRQRCGPYLHYGRSAQNGRPTIHRASASAAYRNNSRRRRRRKG